MASTRKTGSRRRPKTKRDALARLTREALEIEQLTALEAGALGYYARILVQCTLPHSEPEGIAFERVNGRFTLTLTGLPAMGLPYGRYPRLLLAWMTTEAVITGDPVLCLGESLSWFMHELGELQATGGRWGTISRLRDQMKRLFSSSVSCAYSAPEEGKWEERGFRIASGSELWWNPKSPEQAALWESWVELTPDFFKAVTDRPVPVDLRALRVLQSPLALDIYTWLTWRVSFLRQKTEIPWAALAAQFGSNYARVRDFKHYFLEHCKSVVELYPEARLSEGRYGLVIKPSRTHVPRLPRKR